MNDALNFDFLRLNDQLNGRQRALRQQVQDFVQTAVLPHINPYWERAEFPRDIALRLAELPIIPGVHTMPRPPC